MKKLLPEWCIQSGGGSMKLYANAVPQKLQCKTSETGAGQEPPNALSNARAKSGKKQQQSDSQHAPHIQQRSQQGFAGNSGSKPVNLHLQPTCTAASWLALVSRLL